MHCDPAPCSWAIFDCYPEKQKSIAVSHSTKTKEKRFEKETRLTCLVLFSRFKRFIPGTAIVSATDGTNCRHTHKRYTRNQPLYLWIAPTTCVISRLTDLIAEANFCRRQMTRFPPIYLFGRRTHTQELQEDGGINASERRGRLCVCVETT